MEKKIKNNKGYKKAISLEGIVFIGLFILFFYLLGHKMGVVNMFNTLMNTAHDLLLNTVFYIMGIAVLAGSIAALLSEFGVVSIVNKILSPLMKPIYDLPGAATLGIVTTYLSDNPAIITLAQDEGFKRYFKKYQIPALTNLGTAFGMGLIVTTYMIAQKSPIGESFIGPALIGNLGAFAGSIISVRIMLHFTKKQYGQEDVSIEMNITDGVNILNYRGIREGSVGKRFLEAMLEGGKSGVEMGMAVIPGVLIICTFVLMLTKGPSAAGYTGAAYEGVPVLPWIGDKLSFIINPLLGFKNSQAIAFPVTALGAVGAAIGLVPELLKNNLIGGNEIAVFTAMGMCWSGYLSTHVAMMDSLGCREITGKAILSHTIGGLCAGTVAHFLYVLIF
ncbi:CD0519/CD1768 family membrane protein [Haloimpatiens massiliensis]|uniref:CD0519/CD1768 family membrane protein n=1 Tax=Haloimpatiens massiliensis TaxID=1658110 RepID=UPI0015E14457|nr:hypothetical protein [Haloimpatiens massiliensis]